MPSQSVAELVSESSLPDVKACAHVPLIVAYLRDWHWGLGKGCVYALTWHYPQPTTLDTLPGKFTLAHTQSGEASRMCPACKNVAHVCPLKESICTAASHEHTYVTCRYTDTSRHISRHTCIYIKTDIELIALVVLSHHLSICPLFDMGLCSSSVRCGLFFYPLNLGLAVGLALANAMLADTA